ncbi:DDE-type integrase/transposase/recombinase [Labrenzia sp. PHM005]|uniref:DDE-type integrase/transposase/recombinase n=1 Tax=Labrenzia sp. PHM005 TaxID=2590016 RepID=UPI001140784F|nr:DDE-type integrase/transposase/recombinase [Labrenzia sp. PHM005]QDG74428.1 DDE-type integrase/transposase/recombinase [Labrenzia sp. PHM005]
MKLWLTAQEIAVLKLEGFPASRYGVQKYAEREGWQGSDLARKRKGREGGGGHEYHIDLLPLAQRLEYAGSFIRVERDDYLLETTNALNQRELSTRDARLIVLKVAERFRKTSGLKATGSDHLFCQLFEDGKVPLPDWVLEHVKRISVRTMHRWRKDALTNINQLAHDPSRARKGTGILDRAEDGRVRNYILALYVSNQFLSAKHIRDAVLAEFGETLLIERKGRFEQVSTPPLRTFQNALKNWLSQDKNVLLKLTDPDAYKSKVRFVATGANRMDRLNQKWEIDASRSDVMTTDGRMNIYAAIDLYSRRVIILVTENPRAAAVGLLIRRCILAWGVPETIKSDNGSDFIAKSIVRLLDALGIEHELSSPYSPEQKGTVERVIGTFQRDFAATQPGFIGHSVADRKIIEARKAFSARHGTDDAKLFNVELSAQELQHYADQWAEERYAHTPHEGLKRKTPYQVAQAYTGSVHALNDPTALNVLLAPIAGQNGLRKVTKQGIRVGGEYFYTGDVLPGTEILARHDPEDLGKLWLFEPDGESYLGEAINPDLAGLDPAETIQKVRAKQKAIEDERLADIRKEKRRITPRTIAEAQRAATQHNADVLSFPKPSQKYETAKMQAASAVKAKRTPIPLSDDQRQMMEQLQKKPAAPDKVTQLNALDTADKRFFRARQLEARIANGSKLSNKEAIWLADYQSDPEYRARMMLLEDDPLLKSQVPPAS